MLIFGYRMIAPVGQIPLVADFLYTAGIAVAVRVLRNFPAPAIFLFVEIGIRKGGMIKK